MAAAIVHGPRVLVLDEPTSGLDPAQVLDFRALLRELRAETTILLSSHVLAEVEASCDRAVLIDRGRAVASGTIAELRARGAASERIELECAADADAALRALSGVRAVRVARTADGWHACEVDADEGTDVQALAERAGRALASAGIAVRRMERSALPLESVFHRILAASAGVPR